MKHTSSVTLTILGIFFIAQMIGLVIVNNYIDHQQLQEKGVISFKDLPLNVERPQIEEQTSFIYIVISVLIGTVLIFLLIRFRQQFLWKLWFFMAVFITLDVA